MSTRTELQQTTPELVSGVIFPSINKPELVFCFNYKRNNVILWNKWCRVQSIDGQWEVVRLCHQLLQYIVKVDRIIFEGGHLVKIHRKVSQIGNVFSHKAVYQIE